MSAFDVERMHIIVQIYRIFSDLETLQTAFINYAAFESRHAHSVASFKLHAISFLLYSSPETVLAVS